MSLKEHEYEPPEQRELEGQVASHWKLMHPKYYRAMKKSGELDEFCKDAANRTRRLAENYIATGTFPAQAWQWAIREVILEVERD